MINNVLKISGGGVLVQRGITSGASTVAINEVDMDKTIVLSVSKGSAGYVAARGQSELRVNKDVYDSGSSDHEYTQGTKAVYSNGNTVTSTRINATENQTFSLSGGTTDLTVKEYSARLISPTELECDGPVEWQVIEFK